MPGGAAWHDPFHFCDVSASSLKARAHWPDIDMIELLLSYGFDTLEYSWVKVTIDICTLAYYSMAKKC
jgi:hypothetical protein